MPLKEINMYELKIYDYVWIKSENKEETNKLFVEITKTIFLPFCPLTNMAIHKDGISIPIHHLNISLHYDCDKNIFEYHNSCSFKTEQEVREYVEKLDKAGGYTFKYENQL